MTDPGFGILKSELIWEKGEGHVGSCCDRIILVGRGSSGYRRARATRQTQAGANPLVKHLRGKTFLRHASTQDSWDALSSMPSSIPRLIFASEPEFESILSRWTDRGRCVRLSIR